MSTATVDAASRPAIGRGFRLQWEAAQNAHVLLYPEGMIKLNGSAGEILKRCDGATSICRHHCGSRTRLCNIESVG